MSDTWRRPTPDRSARVRVVPEPATDTPGGVPALTKQFMRDMPNWQKFTIGIVLAITTGGGLSLAGASKLLGVETTQSADAREARILARIASGETRVTDLEQQRRKEAKQSKDDITKVIREALGASTPQKKRKPKPRPEVEDEETQ